MKKVEAEYYFDGEALKLVNEGYVLEQCKKAFDAGTYLDLTIKNAFQWKSNAQMGRFFGAIADAVHLFLKESGYKFPDKLASVYYIMENLPSEAGYGLSDKWVEFSYDPNGRVISRKAMSISGMSRAELNELDADLSNFLLGVGIEVPDSEEFKKSKRYA